MYYKGKWCTAGGKDPLFGHVDGFQIDPKILKKILIARRARSSYETCFVISFLINHKTGSAFLIKILILIRKQYYIFRGAPIWMRPIFYFREKDP